jgi:hypothetical protein
MDIYIKTNEFGIIIEYTHYNFSGFKKVTLPSDLVETNLIGWQYSNGELYKPLQILKEEKLEELKKVYNESKKITIQNGKTLIIDHNTPERKYFLQNLPKVPNWNEISFLEIMNIAVLSIGNQKMEKFMVFLPIP